MRAVSVWHEPEWNESPTFRGSADFAASPLTPASGNPLDLLPPLDRLIYLGRAFRVPMVDLARVLRMSREQIYYHLRQARAQLEPLAEPKLGRRCIVCGGPRPTGRVRCDECLQSRATKAAAGRAGAARRWRKPTPRTPTGAGGRRV